MIRSVFLFLVFTTILSVGAEISLRPKPGLVGHDTNTSVIRLHELSGSGDFWVQVIATDFPDPIGAVQVEVKYPAHWVMVEGPAPLQTGTNLSSEYVAFLPSTPEGVYQPSMVDNAHGKWRAMMVIGDFQSHLSPSQAPQVLMEMRFRARGVADSVCQSANGMISIRPPSQDLLLGSMVLNHRAQPMSFDLSENHSVTLVYEHALHKGNLTRYLHGGDDHVIDYDDWVVLYRGVTRGQRAAGLQHLTQAEYRQLTDLNCSGGDPDGTDLEELQALIQRQEMIGKQKFSAHLLEPSNGHFQLDLNQFPFGVVIEGSASDPNFSALVQQLETVSTVQFLPPYRKTRSPLLILVPTPGQAPSLLTWPMQEDRVLPLTMTPLTNVSRDELIEE